MSLRKIATSGNFKRKLKKNVQRIITEKVNHDFNEEVNSHDNNVLHSDENLLNLPGCSGSSGPSNKIPAICTNEILSDESDFEEPLQLENNISNFKQELKAWSLKHQITHVALKGLLEIVNKHTDFQLPKDPRTFLSTPIKKIEQIKNITGGQYWHNGLRDCIEQVYHNTDTSQDISININMDGLPIFNSSKFEFWPILFNINELETKPMIIGMYYGKGKPFNPKEFLNTFVEELLMILNEGVTIGAHKINVSVKCFICDSPARSYIKGVANFNSQHGCQKCTIIGEYSYVSHTNYYPNREYTKRTDEDFRKKKDELHHKVDSEILKLPIDMINCFPVSDCLHLVDLGVTKKLLVGWRDGTFKNKLLKWPARTTETLTTQMLKIKLPKELHRAVRGLDCLSFWKALEYRNFLLYYGIVILKDVLRADVYEHFLCLFCAITICSTDFYKVHVDVAEALLKHFVDGYCKIYGEHYVTSNIHNLTHLVDDVRILGNLTKISAYPFETKLYEIKNLIRSGNNPLAQVAKRLIEKQNADTCISIETEKNIYPHLKYLTDNLNLSELIKTKGKSGAIYKMLFFKDFCLGGLKDNCWFLTKENCIVRFLAVSCIQSKIIISGKKNRHTVSFFKIPIDSTVLNIHSTLESTISDTDTHSIPEEIFSITDIKCKLVCVLNKGQCTFIPILHTLC